MHRTPFPLLVGLLAAGCASSRAVDDVHVPLRAGVVPIFGEPTDGPEDPADADADDGLRLALDAEALTDDLTVELERLFAGAVRLELPAPPAGGWSVEEREAAIRAAALAADVDVVVWPELEYSPGVRTSANEKLWLNLPLFLIGGPLNWFPNDRSYFVDAKLAFHVLDGAKLQDTQLARLRDRSLVFGRSSSTEVELDLFDRAGGGVGHYALGILVPGVLLARETEQAERSLGEEVRRTLAEQAVSELGREVDELIQGGGVVDFHPRLGLRTAPGGWELGGDVVLSDTRVPYLSTLEVDVPGRGRLVQEFEEVDFEDVPFGSIARRVYPVTPVRVTEEEARSGLRATIVDASGAYRTFTYVLR